MIGLSLSSLGLGLGRRGSVFSPVSLFAAGEQGYWLDPSDFSTMFQDTAGATPVTAVGQSVRRWLDKSGRGNHFTQSSTSNAPILQQDAGGRYFLLFDGTDDWLQSGTITPGTDKVQVFAGVRKLSDVAAGTVVESSIIATGNQGAFFLRSPQALSSATHSFLSGGSIYSTTISPTSFPAPITNVLTGLGDISGDSAILRVNGTQAASSATDQGTGNYLAYPHYIGRRAGTSLPFNGRIYQLITRFGPNLTAAQIQQVEAFVNSRTGAY